MIRDLSYIREEKCSTRANAILLHEICDALLDKRTITVSFFESCLNCVVTPRAEFTFLEKQREKIDSSSRH